MPSEKTARPASPATASAGPVQTRSAKKGRGGWWFLLLVIALYILVWMFNAGFVAASLEHFQRLVVSIAPVLALVFVILWLLNLSQGMQNRLAKLADTRSGLKGWLLAVIGGILSHGPIYAWYPLLQKLENQGARPALLAAFLYARSIKIPFLPLMVHYFGITYTVIVTLYIAVFSVLHGWLVEKIMQDTLPGRQ